ncbi:MAG TPA: cohesin domain-containing protein [Saprospiraceae bacterium]|nr:cohesin domain-containing protein [Saprospiraceae bacterium]HNL39791.1 cohesin domain-containing protein [Saprospiraceae bacterium]HNM24662.1 cohesin domain-containing protein [Saprospiraceae bacterium]
MNHRLLILLANIWLATAYSLPAQVGFALPFINEASQGQVMNLPVNVSNFDSILSVQFVIRWDPEVLQFISVGTYSLPDLGDEDFGLTQAQDSGIFRFAWYSTDSFGISKPDDFTIFKIKFKVIGPLLSGTEVYFTELPPLTFFEVTQRGGTTYGFTEPDDVAPILEQGFVAVGYTVAAGEPATAPDVNIQIFPNPFSDRTQVVFDAEKAAFAQVSVCDALGRTLLRKQMNWLPGRNGMEIERSNLPASGTCFLVVQSEGRTWTRALEIR